AGECEGGGRGIVPAAHRTHRRAGGFLRGPHLVDHRTRGEVMAFRRPGQDAPPTEAEELAVYRAYVRLLTRTCEAAAGGDLEARSQPVPGSEGVPELVALHDAVNRVLDVSDAFVRESSAALTSAAEGGFPRRL